MAEVIGAEQARRLMAIYPHPNQVAEAPADERKNQLNLFLGEWNRPLPSSCGTKWSRWL